MKAVAKQFPKTHFAIVDVSNADEGGLKNVAGPPLQGAGGRLPRRLRRRARRQGSAAARRSRPSAARSSRRSTATSRASRPARRRPFPGVKTLNGYSQDFENQAKCKEVALNQIAAGSVVVFQVAGGCGLGALDAAKEKGVWGVGVDADQGYLGHVRPHLGAEARRHGGLRLDPDAKAGKFKGGTDAVYGFDIGGVGIGKFSPKTPTGIAAKVAVDQAADRLREDHEHPDDGRSDGGLRRKTAPRAAEGQQLRRRRDGRRGRAAADERRLGRHRRRERPLQHDQLARQGPQPAREPARLDQRLGQRRPLQVLRGRRHGRARRDGCERAHQRALAPYEGKDFHTPVDRVIVRIKPERVLDHGICD